MAAPPGADAREHGIARVVRPLEAAVALVCRLAALLGALTGLICFVLVCLSVAWRYFLGQPQPWIDYVAAWLVVALVMFTAAETQRRDEHIGVEVLTSRLPRAPRRLARILASASVAATAAVLLAEGLATVSFSRMVGIATDVEGVPIWWVQTLIPLGAALLLAAALAQIVVLACGLEPRGPDPKPHGEIPSGRAE